jgi:amino acid adenylation domain-containing protein
MPLHPQVNEIIGDFTSMTLVAVDNTEVSSFETRSRRIQERLWETLDHSEVSGVQILRELSRVQGQEGKAMMPVVFTSTIGLASDDPGSIASRMKVIHSVSQTPQVWIDHQVHEQNGDLVFNWDAVEELFPDGLLQDMFDAYCGLLDRLAGHESVWEKDFISLTPEWQLAQREQVNSAEASIPDAPLHKLFLEQAQRRPEATAVLTPARTISYGELYLRSNRLARRLLELGAQPNTLVAIVMEKGWEQVVAALAVLQAGAAYLPIDPTLPKERRWYLLQHSEVRILITQPGLEQTLEWPGGVSRLTVEAETTPAEPVSTPQVEPTDLAYVIYTSGSTGLPKGVMIDHRGAVNTILDINARFGIGPQDRVLALSSLSFDLSVYDIFGMLAAGGTVVFPEAGALPDPARWAELMDLNRVTVWNTVPALMGMLVEYLSGRSQRLASSLRLVMLSGDWIPIALPDQIRALNNSLQVVSLGGATEASIWSILYPIDQVAPEWKSIPYGKPMLNQSFQVYDDKMTPRPVWAPGNLYIGGIGVAKGYWRDPEKTGMSFILHPETRERIYRTGDLGRYLPDGNIEFLGRVDSQVKIMGYRIELGEIEAALAEHDSIQACAVTVAPDHSGNKKLAAYIVFRPGNSIEVDEIRSHLRSKLPDYMIPVFIIPVEKLALSANGKVDRKALSQITQPLSRENPDKTSNQSLILPRITRLVADFLQCDQLDPESNLLDFGASSVDMIRIANLLQNELEFRPGIDEFYRNPTLSGLAELYELSRSNVGNRPMELIAEPERNLFNPSALPIYEFLADPMERERFKERRPGLRALADDSEVIRLTSPGEENTLEGRYAERRTHRRFLRRPIPLSKFAEFISCLRDIRINGAPKYLYPSAGGIYPVQTYLHVKDGRIEGLRAGTYYYHPDHHLLAPLTPGVELPEETHDALVNRPVYREAAFSLFLIAQMRAVAPVYGQHSIPFVYLEAGYVGQLMMMNAPAHDIGLCPIGILDFPKIRDMFLLDDGHVLAHSMLGGLIGGVENEEWGAVQETYIESFAPESDLEEFEI